MGKLGGQHAQNPRRPFQSKPDRKRYHQIPTNCPYSSCSFVIHLDLRAKPRIARAPNTVVEARYVGRYTHTHTYVLHPQTVEERRREK